MLDLSSVIDAPVVPNERTTGGAQDAPTLVSERPPALPRNVCTTMPHGSPLCETESRLCSGTGLKESP